MTTYIWLFGGIALIAIAFLLLAVWRGKHASADTGRWWWLIVCSNILVGVDIVICIADIYHETDPTKTWIVNLSFLILLIPIYILAAINILRDSPRQDALPEEEIPESPEAGIFAQDKPPLPASQNRRTRKVPHNYPQKNMGGSGSTSQTMDDAERVVARWISQRCYTDSTMTVDKALEQMGITLTMLNKYLERHYDAGSFRKWLSYLRIEEAKRQIFKHPGYSLQSIAEACGYSNNQSLTKAFKMQEGIPPSEWLARIRK